MDPTTILIDNLRDALGQVNQFLGLGLVAAISAFVLDRAPAPADSDVESTAVPGFPVKMPRDAAQSVLLGVNFVAGLMAYIAADGALTILSQLSAPIQDAACTQASIVTSAIGYRVVAAVLPFPFVILILLRRWKRLRAASPEDSRGLITLLVFLMVPYLALGLVLLRVKCGN
ncbi:MAG: hypothetical protein ACKVQW_06630 [Pyrinomonadaceae bacterium]